MDKKNKFISATYQLYSVVDGKKELEEQTGDDRPYMFVSGFGLSLDAFEENLMATEEGAEFDFTLQPAEAFGDYVPEGVHKLNREIFSINGHFDHDNIFEGAVITLQDEEQHHFMAKVVKIEEDGVTVDTNHPLAGKALNFTGKVLINRDATEEEIKQTIKHLTGDRSCGCGCGCGHEHGEGCEDGCEGGCEGHHHEEGCNCGHCH